jgi:predicted DNA-binding transcriptional regulator YafY
MRATRLVSLLLLLQTRGQLTAAELAGTLEISVRTVHRDMESLASAGVPVEAVRGPTGGYRLAGGYRTRLTGLTADEAEALFATGMSGPAAELGLGGELAAARLKLLAALPSELQERATRASRLFHLDTRGWFRAEDSVPHLPALSSAVWSGCRVRLRYREGPRVVQRTIDPLGLVLKGGAWYLIARRSAGMRVYRVSRVAAVRALPDAFERPAGFELETFWEEWSRAFEQSRSISARRTASCCASARTPRCSRRRTCGSASRRPGTSWRPCTGAETSGSRLTAVRRHRYNVPRTPRRCGAAGYEA